MAPVWTVALPMLRKREGGAIGARDHRQRLEYGAGAGEIDVNLREARSQQREATVAEGGRGCRAAGKIVRSIEKLTSRSLPHRRGGGAILLARATANASVTRNPSTAPAIPRWRLGLRLQVDGAKQRCITLTCGLRSKHGETGRRAGGRGRRGGNRVRPAVERTVSFDLLCQSLAIIWYALDTRRALTLRGTLIRAEFRQAAGGRPTVRNIARPALPRSRAVGEVVKVESVRQTDKAHHIDCHPLTLLPSPQ